MSFTQIFFKGGVHLTKEATKVPELVNAMIGHRLITKQTPPDGIPVSKVMVAEAIDIVRETYFCILMDREHNGPVIVASPDGGVDIEEVAEKTPERIKKMPVDIKTGLTDEAAIEVAEFLGMCDTIGFQSYVVSVIFNSNAVNYAF